MIYWGLLQQSDLPIHKFTASLLLYYLCYHQSLGLIRHSTSNLQSFQSLSPESQSSLLYAQALLFPSCRCLLPFCPSLQPWAEHRRSRRCLRLLHQLSVTHSPSFLSWWLWLRAAPCTQLGTGTFALQISWKKCCQDNVLPLILPLRPCKHFWATKCSVNFLCCFTQHQFFKADQLQECLQHFSTAASIKHLRSLLMSQTGIQPYTCWGVTDPWWRSPSGISVEQAVGMQLAGSPARSCSLLSRGGMASHAQDALRMHKRVQKFFKNPNHVLVSSMLCLEWPWAIAQYSSCHCGSCLEWLGMNVSCAGDFCIFFYVLVMTDSGCNMRLAALSCGRGSSAAQCPGHWLEMGRSCTHPAPMTP